MWPLLAAFLGLLPAAILISIIWTIKSRLDRSERRDPITTELRHLPGSGLQKERDDLVETQETRMFSAILTGVALSMAILARHIDGGLAGWNWADSLLVLLIVAVGGYYGRLVARDMPRSRQLRQGLRAEQAAAQELAAVLAGSNRLIHDIRAKDFNIDHVVVTPAGIFAVETKSRLKPPAGSGAEAVKVRYDGERLEFPGWVEKQPIVQAARRAKWLADHLQQATGERFPVFPVLALPGWYVENTARIGDDKVRVINPKKCSWLLLPENRPPRLDAAAIQRAAFAIEKLATAGEA